MSGRTDTDAASDERDDRTETRWPGDGPPLEADLPADIQQALGSFVDEQVETLADWASAVRDGVDGTVDREKLCHAGEGTPHWGDLDGQRYHFACFYDAVVLAALADEPVDVRTESPGGTAIEAQAVGTDELTVTPEEAVFSFGVERDPDPPTDREVTPEDVYPAVCPYVKAFPNRTAYEEWATDVPAATVATSLAGATDLAAALVE